MITTFKTVDSFFFFFFFSEKIRHDISSNSQMKHINMKPYFCRKLIEVDVLRFYGPVNPMGSCRARSVYLTTRLLGRLSPLSG